MTTLLILIIVLTIFSGITSFLIVKVQLLKKEIKELKNTCNIAGKSIYNAASRISSGNASHSKGNIQNMAQLIKKIGEI
jgi:hypothetical protein